MLVRKFSKKLLRKSFTDPGGGGSVYEIETDEERGGMVDPKDGTNGNKGRKRRSRQECRDGVQAGEKAATGATTDAAGKVR